MRNDRNLAINLRKQGKSYSQITQELGISKSTLSVWFRNNQWSKDIRVNLVKIAQIKAKGNLRLMALANKTKWNKWYETYQQEAITEFPKLVENPLFISGLMLYWGEGDRVLKNGIVRMVNSDPEMIRIFHSFLRITLLLPTEKIHFRLTLYPDLSDLTYKRLWGRILNVPISQFKNSAYIQGKHPNRRLSYGMCTIEVYSRGLKEKILIWIKLFQKHFGDKYL